jgi:hypothetical protein
VEITKEWLQGQRLDFLRQAQEVSDNLLKIQGAIGLIDHQIALCDQPEEREHLDVCASHNGEPCDCGEDAIGKGIHMPDCGTYSEKPCDCGLAEIMIKEGKPPWTIPPFKGKTGDTLQVRGLDSA